LGYPQTQPLFSHPFWTSQEEQLGQSLTFDGGAELPPLFQVPSQRCQSHGWKGKKRAADW
jgi:hypothetical protein